MNLKSSYLSLMSSWDRPALQLLLFQYKTFISPKDCLCSFSRPANTKCHTLGGLRNRNTSYPSPGGWNFKIRVSTGLVPPEDMTKTLPCHSPGWLAIAGVPWLVHTHFTSSLSDFMFTWQTPCMHTSVPFPLFTGTPVVLG